MATKRKRSTTSDSSRRRNFNYGEQRDLNDLRAVLTGMAKGSKSSVARVLTILNEHGQLTDTRLGGSSELMHLVSATKEHGEQMTPYGTVIQRLQLTEEYDLDYVHPCAYLHYASTISDSFCRFINEVLDNANSEPLDIIVYGDEMTPGNPLRPDKGREAWQWSFSILQFPNHVLHSHGGWIHILTIRTSVLRDLKGGVPMLANNVLHMMLSLIHI